MVRHHAKSRSGPNFGLNRDGNLEGEAGKLEPEKENGRRKKTKRERERERER